VAALWRWQFSSSAQLTSSSGKKRLLASTRDTWRLLLPFLLWEATVVAVYASAYTKLHSMGYPITQLNAGNVVVYGSTRLIYHSLLVCSASTDAAKAAAQAALAQEVRYAVELSRAELALDAG
jgi:hypothetical protein